MGATFGNRADSEFTRCAHDIENIFHETKRFWSTSNPTGTHLYEYAQTLTQKMGWVLNVEGAPEHRLSDFPHVVRSRAKLEEEPESIEPGNWVLEIQIQHPSKKWGGFYEDLLI